MTGVITTSSTVLSITWPVAFGRSCPGGMFGPSTKIDERQSTIALPTIQRIATRAV